MTAYQASPPSLGWAGIVRLGLVQMSLGAIVVLMTSTLNRLMNVELGLAASLAGALVGWHYAVQMSRPRWGYGADAGRRRSPWIIGGMAVLALGAALAATALAIVPASPPAGLLLSLVAYTLIGLGVGAAGTNLLALLAVVTPPERKAAAAAIVWIMMIAGFILTAGIGGSFLEPFSFLRLISVTVGTGVTALLITSLALRGIEQRAAPPAESGLRPADFARTLSEVWRETPARRFTIFVFVSMFAYGMQELIIEPLAGLVYGYAPAASTKLSGVQNMGALAGMVIAAVAGTLVGRSRTDFLRQWTAAGCLASAAALGTLAIGVRLSGADWPLGPNIFLLGLANGSFAVSAIGTMMALASQGKGAREGTRMGLWGAAQAIAFGLGGFIGAAGLDIARAFTPSTETAFAMVFSIEAALFMVAAWLAIQAGQAVAAAPRHDYPPTRQALNSRTGDAR